MTKVYSERFCWKKSKNDETLIVQMKMEDFSSASEPVMNNNNKNNSNNDNNNNMDHDDDNNNYDNYS